jgi:hypothetical protein
VKVCSIGEISSELEKHKNVAGYCLDISSFPRIHIFNLLCAVLEASKGIVPIWIVYTYPQTYVYGSLQEAGSDVICYFDRPHLERNTQPAVIMSPGFDAEFTNLALAYIKAATDTEPLVRWLFAFPPRKYHFYERALENHVYLMGGVAPILYSQSHITLALERLTQEISGMGGRSTFIVPLGPRISCVAAFIAALRARREKREVNILLPHTRRYSAIRSEGSDVPLIEKLPLPFESYDGWVG